MSATILVVLAAAWIVGNVVFGIGQGVYRGVRDVREYRREQRGRS